MDNLYLFEMLKDDPENIKRIDDALYDIKRSMYSNAYNAQRAISIMYRIDIPFSAHRKVKGNRIAFDINYTYVEAKGRNAFRKSKYYKEEIHSAELFRNYNTFSKGVLVFIDGKLTTNFYIYMSEDKTEIRFAKHFVKSSTMYTDGFWSGAIENMSDNGSILTVIVIPMCKHSFGQTTMGAIADNDLTISLDDEYLVASSDMEAAKIPMLFIGRKHPDEYINGLFSDNIPYTVNNGKMVIPQEVLSMMLRPQPLYVDIFIPTNLFIMKTVPNDGWFELPIMKMPIPHEQILVFKKSTYGGMQLCLSGIDMYYPNKYHITETDYDGEYVIYVFYNNDIESTVLSHTNELSLYTTYMDSLSQYRDGSVIRPIKNYTPVSTDYSIDKYIESGVHSLSYKIETLRTLIKKNPALYKYYLERYVEHYPNSILIVDEDMYNDRIRTDSSMETPDNVITFDTPRFMFSMRKENNAQAFRIFIDNKCYIFPDGHSWFSEDSDFIYYYIPATDVKVGSYIEVQKMNNTAMRESYTVNTSVPTKLIINKDYHMKADDIYITYDDGTTEVYVTNYTLCELVGDTRAEEDTDIIIGNNRYKPVPLFNKYNELYIVWDDDTYNGKTITVRSDKFYTTHGDIDTETIIEYNHTIENDRRNFLIFRDGRLMAPNGISAKFSRNPNGPHTIQTLVIGGDGVRIDLEHMPDKYDLVLDYHDDYVKRLRIYQKYMGDDIGIDDRHDNIYDMQINRSVKLENAIMESGHFIDLTNLITKPLDFRWYDIYMNGLKLTERDVKFIAPYYMLITLEDDYPDIDSFIIIDMITFIEKYVIPLPFLNPDWQQVSDAAIREYPDVVDENQNVEFDADSEFSMTRSVILNPDDIDGYTTQ